MKRTLLVLILILTMLATCMVGCGLIDSAGATDSEKENAAAIFTLDVNPGVRIYVRADDSVIAVEATNEDGEEVIAEIEIDGKDYEEIVEELIDKMEENGYISDEEACILISVEKKVKDISEKLNEKVEKSFEKHGKTASIIEQELDELDEKISKEIDEMENKYHISKGKAHLIEKIREEFPELSEEELAKLNINDLRMMLEETSEDVKENFKKIDEHVHREYIDKDAALSAALASLEITAEDVTMSRVRITYANKNMFYLVEFVYDGMEYEISVDAVSGEILETKSNEYVEINPEDIIGDFCDKHNINPEDIKDHIDNIFNKEEHKDNHKENDKEDHTDNNLPEEKPLTKAELLNAIFTKFGISEESLKRTDVRLYSAENGSVYSVTIVNNNGSVYTFIVEAFSGTIIKAELNRIEIDLANFIDN